MFLQYLPPCTTEAFHKFTESTIHSEYSTIPLSVRFTFTQYHHKVSTPNSQYIIFVSM